MNPLELSPREKIRSLVGKVREYVDGPGPVFKEGVPPIAVERWRTRLEIGFRGKYLYNDHEYEVIPRPDDTVVEAGVYVGKDTATFAKFADRVIGFEPSPRNHTEAERNLDSFENVTLLNEGLWDEAGELEIKYGIGSGDDGFLDPDEGASVEERHEVPVDTLESRLEELGVGGVDFLKVEAEGAEPEIIDGMGALRPRNIVVNAGEERDGQPTGTKVMDSLQSKGYTLVGMKRGHILFFTSDDVSHAAFRSAFG